MRHRCKFMVLLGFVLFLTAGAAAQMPMDMPLMHERMYKMMGGEEQFLETPGQYSLDKMVQGLRHLALKVTKSNNEHQEVKVLLSMAAELNLTEEQTAKLRQLNLDHQKVVIRKGAAASEAIMELENLLTSDAPDKTTVSNKVIEAMGAIADIYQNCLETNLDIKALLTKDQNKSLDTLSHVMKAKAEPPSPQEMEQLMRQHRKEIKMQKEEMEMKNE